MHAATDAANDVKPITEDVFDDGSAGKHCGYDMESKLKCLGGRL